MGRWVAEVHVPVEAAVVDFVMCDGDRRFWDNNRMCDFHSAVRDAFSVQQLAQVRPLRPTTKQEQNPLRKKSLG